MLDRTDDFSASRTNEDVGLRLFMASLYLRMAGGVAITAAACWFASHDATLAAALFTAEGLTTLGWIVTFAPLGLVFLLSAGVDRLGAATAELVFALYAALVGLSLGGLMFVYTGASLATTFLSAAGGFVALALAGSTSRRDLSGIGAFLTIGLTGLVVAMLVNLFARSGDFDLMLSVIGLALFAGLTAVDAQRLEHLYRQAVSEGRTPRAILGALTLYLDFLNLFLFLLRFTGERRR